MHFFITLNGQCYTPVLVVAVARVIKSKYIIHWILQLLRYEQKNIMSTCLDDVATQTLQEVFNQNPNLPPGITVGRLINNSDIFCLDNVHQLSDEHEESGQVCYKDIPGVHRALSAFNLIIFSSCSFWAEA